MLNKLKHMNLDQDKLNFNSHLVHNPYCDILEYQINDDTYITYGMYVKPSVSNKGPIEMVLPVCTEFMEIYTGENYNVNSKKRGHSKMYYKNEIPEKYKALWVSIRSYYIRHILTPDTFA